MATLDSLLTPDEMNVAPGLLPPPQAAQGGGLLATPPQAQQSAPQVPPQQSQDYPVQIPTRAPVNSVLAGIDNLLMGGAFQRGSKAHYDQLVNNAQIQRQYAAAVNYAGSLPQSERSLFWNDPQGYIKQAQANEAQQVVAGGSTLIGHRDAATGLGDPITAPLIGHDDKSGAGYSIDGAGVQSTGGVANGGDFSNSGGVVTSGRTGGLQGIVTPPTSFAAGNTYVPTQVQGFGAPGAGGPPPGTPMLGAPTTSGASAPRGIRNNNYTNLTALPNGQKWNGQTGVDKGGYVQFDTPQNGLAAAAQNLNAYATKHGINTVAGLVGRWAPSGAGNNTAAYTQFVAQKLGVSPTATIDLTDPAVAQKALGAISAFENGPKAFGPGSGAPPPQLGAPKAATTGPAPTNLPPGSIPGKLAQPLTPDDIRSQGLAPGRYQREPDGKITTISQAPKDDMARISSLQATAEGLRNLEMEQNDFLTHNRNFATGAPAGDMNILGHKIENPIMDAMETANPDAKAMSASSGKQLFMVKPANAGARILQSEIPFWQNQTQGVGLGGNVNQGIHATTVTNRDRATAKANFFSNYIYKNGNLDGADQAFDQNQGGQGSAPQLQTLTPEQATKLPSGTHFMTTDGRQLVRH